LADLYCVRAEYGRYSDRFVKGGYAAIGWNAIGDPSRIKDRDQVKKLYIELYPDDKSPYVIGQQVGQVTRFILDMQVGDYVITPDHDVEYVYWGVVESQPYYYNEPDDGCPFLVRRKVKWNPDRLPRRNFSVPFQNSIRSSLTVFSIESKNEFLEMIGRPDSEVKKEVRIHESTDELVLRRILELTAKEFEILVTELLATIGFDAEHTGKTGDEGIDSRGKLDIYGLAKVDLYVQAKRYKIGSRISPKDVKKMRQNIPTGSQGAFITTADFSKDALSAAIEQGFPRIGTINGRQLVDLLSAKWEDLPAELRQKLGLRRSLVAP